MPEIIRDESVIGDLSSERLNLSSRDEKVPEMKFLFSTNCFLAQNRLSIMNKFSMNKYVWYL